MNDLTLTTALEPVVHGIVNLALQDAAFRANLRMLLGPFMELLDDHIAIEAPPTPNIEILDIHILGENTVPEVDDPAAVTVPRATNYDSPEIEDIGPRCRLKAKAAAWQVTRRRLIQEGFSFRDEIAPQDQSLIAEAKNLRCYLWMCRTDYSPPTNLALLADLARHYELMADTFSLVLGLVGRKRTRMLREALGLLAQVNRRLWIALEMADAPRDSDQQAVFVYLKTVTQECRMFVGEMCNDSPLPELAEISARIHLLKNEMDEITALASKRQAHFKAAEYHAHLIASLAARRTIGNG